MSNGDKSRFDRVSRGIYITSKAVRMICNIVVLCCMFFVIFKLVELKNNGWSFHKKEEIIEIDNAQYTAGMEYWNQLDYINAEKKLYEAYEEISQSKGLDDNETAAISQKLGALYLEMGRYPQSIEFLNNAYITFRNNLGDEDGNTIRAKCQLAIYDIRIGNAERGFAALNDAYDQTDYIAYKIQICQMLAQCNTEIGNYPKALEWYDLLGSMYNAYNIHGNTVMLLLNDYGCLEITVGNYEEAVNALESAINYAESESSELANVYAHLSTAYAYVGDDVKSDEAMEEYQKLIEKLFPEENIAYCQLYLNLADWAYLKNDYDLDLEYLNKALSIAQNAVGENHALTASIYNDIGSSYYYKSDIDLAIANHKKALEIRKNILGEDSMDTVQIYENLSEDYLEREDYTQSKYMAEKALSVCQNLVGDNNINAAKSHVNLALAQKKLGEIESGKDNVEKALSICESWFSSDNGTYASVLQSAGLFYAGIKEFDTALDYLQKSLRMYQNTFFEDAMPVINTRIFLGDIYLANEDIEKCSEYFKAAWVAYTKIYSEDDALNNLFEDRLRHLYEESDTGTTYDEWFQSWKSQK